MEGEKDVETMRRKGLPATCNVFGAGEWRPELNVWFRKAKVSIVADKDSSGYRHAWLIEEQLRPIAASVRVVEAAGDSSVKDATDHFGASFGVFDFVELERGESEAVV